MRRAFLWATLVVGSAACSQGTITNLSPPAAPAPEHTFDLPPSSPCNPACSGAQVCSKAGVCVDPGHCAHKDDCLTGEVCDAANGQCVIDERCGAQHIQAEAVPPNLMIVLDRSPSMTMNKVNGVTRWQIAVEALIWITEQHEMLRFGLTLFPDREGHACTQGEIRYPPAEGNGPRIRGFLKSASDEEDDNYPKLPATTNIDTAIEQAAGAPGMEDDSRDRYILLITDGRQEHCAAAGGDAGTEEMIADLRSSGVTTFVLGFGGGVDAEQLDKFAVLGGRPTQNQQHHYYHVDDQRSFAEALDVIAMRSRLACSFTLEEAPPELNDLHVYFDSHEVQRDPSHGDGWDLDLENRHLSFHGEACRDLELNRVVALDIVYGCRRPGQGGVVGACTVEEQPCSAPRECPEDHACLQGCCQYIIR